MTDSRGPLVVASLDWISGDASTARRLPGVRRRLDSRRLDSRCLHSRCGRLGPPRRGPRRDDPRPDERVADVGVDRDHTGRRARTLFTMASEEAQFKPPTSRTVVLVLWSTVPPRCARTVRCCGLALAPGFSVPGHPRREGDGPSERSQRYRCRRCLAPSVST